MGAGAPVVNGVAGSLAAMLDACSRDGFDVKVPVSIVVAGGICTVTWSGTHSAQVDSVVLMSGVADAGLTGLNGEQKVVTKTATTLTFATAAANGTVASPGSCSFKMAPLGFTTPYTGTNVRAYKSSDPTSSGFVLRVDDTGTTSARVVAYESMSDINTGVGPFPTPVQVPSGGYWWKSSAANATANTWFLIGDSKAFYLWIGPWIGGNPAFTYGCTRAFGDPVTLKPGGDPYACFLNCSTATTLSSATDGMLEGNLTAVNFSPRGYTGLGSAIAQMAIPYTGNNNITSGVDGTLGAFPSVIDGGLRLSRKFIAAAANQPPRADLPGLYFVPQSSTYDSFKTGDTAPGVGSLAGRTLVATQSTTPPQFGSAPSAATNGAMFWDRTGPWR